MKTFLFPFALLLLAISSALPEGPIKVASLSTVLTEIAREVGGDRINVVALVKPGMDPHEYEPKPADLKQMSESKLVLASGLHMEGYLSKLKESTGVKGELVEVGNEMPTLEMPHDHSAHEGHDHHHHGDQDPHWWQSIENVQKATKIVRDEFIKLSPEGKADFSKNADAYLDKLAALKKWAKRKVAELPRDKRKLVTSHEAFQYFAKENGFTLYAVEGISSEREVSNKRVSEIIEIIKREGVKAVFFESIRNPKVIQEITRESGAKLGGMLYADGLGNDNAATYEGMIRHNITTIVDALK